MKVCVKCGELNTLTNQVCKNCQASLPAPMSTRATPRQKVWSNEESFKAQLTVPINWEMVRIDAAIAAMQGLLSTKEPVNKQDEKDLAFFSVRCADALVSELKKKEIK